MNWFFAHFRYNMQVKAENISESPVNRRYSNDIYDQEANENYEQKSIDAMLQSAWKAAKVTDIGKEVRDFYFEAKRYSEVSVVGGEGDANVYVDDKQTPDEEKEYEISLSGEINNYKARPKLEAMFHGLKAKFTYDLEHKIDSEITSEALNDFLGCSINFSSQYEPSESSIELKLKEAF